jgi:hypothetical protein
MLTADSKGMVFNDHAMTRKHDATHIVLRGTGFLMLTHTTVLQGHGAGPAASESRLQCNHTEEL